VASLLIAVLLIVTAAEMLWHSIGQTATLSGNTTMLVSALAQLSAGAAEKVAARHAAE
jgi:hypothetical protein